MKTILKPIALYEQSHNINLLHNILAVLGLPAAKTGVAQSRAGKNTLQQVRRLQTHLNVENKTQSRHCGL